MPTCDQCGKPLKNEQGLKFHKRYKHETMYKGQFKTNVSETRTPGEGTHPFNAAEIGGHNIKDSKLGYLLCVKCGYHFDTHQQFASVVCSSIAGEMKKISSRIAKEIREAGGEEKWLAQQNEYVQGKFDWHTTLLPEDRKRIEEPTDA